MSPNPELFEAMVDVDLAEVCITSAATLGRTTKARPTRSGCLTSRASPWWSKLAEGTKCARSWKISPAVGTDPHYPDVTPRDAQALREWEATRARRRNERKRAMSWAPPHPARR